MTQGTTQALSADTPESVSARLDSFAAIWSAGFPDETQHSETLREAASTIRAQAAEIARLAADLCTKTMGEQLLLKIQFDTEARVTEAEAALAASRSQVQAMREALEREAAWNEAEAAMCDRQAEGFKGRNGDRMMRHRCEAAADAHQKAVRRLRAALSTPPTEQPTAADTLARDLAEVVDETWIFLAVWSQTYARERGKPMVPVHAKMLARVHAVMTRAHAAGLIPTVTTTRLPVILAEHGYGADGLLPEGEGMHHG